MCYHCYHDFSHFLVISNDISFFGYIKWTLKAVPDILYNIPIFFLHFLASFKTMKYSGAKNEIARVSIEKLQ
jgi:hypothetical protein